MKNKFKGRFIQDTEKADKTYETLMTLSNAPDVRDRDKGIGYYILVFLFIYIVGIGYFIYYLITM